MIAEIEQILNDYGIKTEQDLDRLVATELHNPYIIANIEDNLKKLQRCVSLDKHIYILHDDSLGSIQSASLLYCYLTKISQLIEIIDVTKFTEKKDLFDVDLIIYCCKKNIEIEIDSIYFEYSQKPQKDSVYSNNLNIHKSLTMIMFDFIRIFNLKALPKGKRIVLKEEIVITMISLFSQKNLYNKEQSCIIRVGIPLLFQTNIIGLNYYLDACNLKEFPSFQEISYYFNLLMYKLLIHKKTPLLVQLITSKNLMVYDIILQNKVDFSFEQAILSKPISNKKYDIFEMDYSIFANLLYKINPIPIESYFYVKIHGLKKFKSVDGSLMVVNDNLSIIGSKDHIFQLKDNLNAQIEGFIVSNGIKCRLYMKNIKI
jgi:hypothetical protein